MKTSFFSAVALLVLTGCGGGDQNNSGLEPEYPSTVTDGVAFQNAPKRAAAEIGLSQQSEQLQYIAYTHTIGLRLPVRAIEPVMQGHIELCNAAGLSQCIVTNSSLNKERDDSASGRLQIRASRVWIDEFMQGVDKEADEAGGKIINHQTSAEDLTRMIIDTGARLNAQTTLKTRLEDLLATRDGELKDLLEIERELARVIGEVESITSNLKALRQRVDMQILSVSYTPKISAIAPHRFNPLGLALKDFLYNLSAGLAAVVTAFAIGLPWLFLLGFILFIWTRLIWPWVRRRRGKQV